MYYLPYFILFKIQRWALDARRRDRTWHYLAWSTLAGVTASILVVAVALVAVLLVSVGWWWLAVLLVVIAGMPIVQPLVLRHIVVPAGWHRVAFWIGHFGTTHDSDAEALSFAAWAHARKPTPTGEAWIAARRDRRKPLGDAEVVTTALLAAGRGDAVTARLLLRSTIDLVERHATVLELAGEWLACDAAERGDWAVLVSDASAARWPATPLTYFLEGLAAVRTGAAGAPGAFELRARWLLAPHRRVTRALLVVKYIAPVQPVQVAAIESPAATEPRPLPRAVAAHVALAGDGVDAAQLGAAVTAWDAALADDATRKWLARRALELDAPLGAADRALREVAVEIIDELARVAERRTLGAPTARGLVGEPLAHRLRHGRLDALEAGFTHWADHRIDGVKRTPVDEWRVFVALRDAYDTAVAAGGQSLRRLAFPHAYKTGNAMAVWLWNAREEYAASHAISAWLLVEALAVGDTEAIELCTRNTRLAVPTRSGRVVTS